jgi:hypothetical protein
VAAFAVNWINAREARAAAGTERMRVFFGFMDVVLEDGFYRWRKRLVA